MRLDASPTPAAEAPSPTASAPQPQAAAPPEPSPEPAALLRVGERFQDACAGCPEMVVLPAGELALNRGAPQGSEAAPPAIIEAAFAVGRREITWTPWRACVAAGGCDGSGPARAGGDKGWGADSRPAIHIAWTDARDFVAWLNAEVEGGGYRLLKEAEWVYAARAGGEGLYSWGDEPPVCEPEAINGAKTAGCGDKRTAPVGSFAANAYGLYDMHGNVWEWVDDCWRAQVAASPRADQGACRLRTVRGGSWVTPGADAGVGARARLSPLMRLPDVGFRVAKDLP